jgi:hypothetical protein
MRTIKKSVKQLIIALLKEKGAMSLQDIVNYVISERETINPAHIRGVLNSDIKSGGKFFKRVTRGQYDINIKSEDIVVEGTPTIEEAIGPTI